MTRSASRSRALRALAKRLGIAASDRSQSLLDAALTHDSYANERAAGDDEPRMSNERLEFLGDSVLGLIVANALYERFPNEPEGKLSRRRSTLVSRPALADAARRIDVGPLLLLGKGEAAARGEERPSILAGVFEALVGAVYLSEGFDAARRFVARERLAEARQPVEADPKTALQEYVQARFKRAPTYAVTLESGPAHAKTFTVAVSIGGTVMGTGSGLTKKQAQAAAAGQALKSLTARARQGRGSIQST